jgi:hypothetical protein
VSRCAAGGTATLPIRVAVLLFLVVPSFAEAQTKAKPTARSGSTQTAAQQRREIARLRSEVDSQRVWIAGQSAHADSQAARIDTLSARLASLEAQLLGMTVRLEAVESDAGRALPDSILEQRLERIEEATKKSPELPPEMVSAGDFPGSIRIPGTDAAVKFGGRVRTAAVFTLDPLGTDDRFLTNSIPVGLVSVSGEDKRTNISARASRLNVDFRTPIGAREVRAFFEGDFAGAGNAFRLRHSYAQFMGFIVGQTWSTFSDPEVDLEDLDFEGVSSENIIRQPLIRYWWRTDPRTRVAFAVETPAVSLTGGTGVNLMPDLIARAVRRHGDEGHVQLAGVLRQIRGEAEPGDVRSDWGWGVSGSGVFPFRLHDLKDRIVFQVNVGKGIARYINDLNSLGGMDAVFDTTTGDLHALSALGWYIGYEHAWKEWAGAETMKLRSTLLWSFVDVDNFDFQPPNAYNKTNRFALNLVFSPADRVDVGVEVIRGSRENKDGEKGEATQVQLVTLIRF